MQHRAVVPAALIVLGVTVPGLASVLNEGQSTTLYWIQTGLIAAYFFGLVILYFRDRE